MPLPRRYPSLSINCAPKRLKEAAAARTRSVPDIPPAASTCARRSRGTARPTYAVCRELVHRDTSVALEQVGTTVQSQPDRLHVCCRGFDLGVTSATVNNAETLCWRLKRSNVINRKHILWLAECFSWLIYF